MSQSASQQSNGDLRCDIMVSNNLESYFIDLCFTNPACKSAITSGSHVKDLAAASRRERDKVLKYNNFGRG